VTLRAEYVLDSSALLAIEGVSERLEKSAVTAVNLAETVNKLAHEASSVEVARGFLASWNSR
jgi:PIN domain nuclease of toxin-antitoxin system